MRTTSLLLPACLLICSLKQLHADIAAIHEHVLPQETAVLGALDDAKQLEPFAAAWTQKWQYPVTRGEVADRLSKDLGFLQLAAKAHPDNAELLLLTGLVARYAYNVDVDGSYEAAMNVLGQAERLLPRDYRASWFRGTLECQTKELAAGAKEFLSIEVDHAWDALPAAFWGDYLNCATIANLPQHALRAVDHLEKLHAGDAADFASAVDINQKRIVAYDPKKKYEPKQVWEAEDKGDETVFVSTTCGVQLHVHQDWRVNQVALNNGSCVAYFSAGPYKAVTSDLHPSVLLLVQQPKQNESLQDFAGKFLSDGTFVPDATLRCPATNCIAMKGVQPGMYKADGDGHGRIVLFERGQPDYPGLIFESPLDLPKSNGTAGVTYYHPDEMQERIPGKLYYLVLLDTAASIEGPALKDYEFFLQNLTVE